VTALLPFIGLAAFALVGAAYALLRELRARRDRLCGCYFCSARREAEAARFYRGPSRLQALRGHLHHLLRLLKGHNL
jgi:hypothetical protein